MGGKLQQPCHRRPSNTSRAPSPPGHHRRTRAEKDAEGEAALGRRLGAGVGACHPHFLIVDMSCQKRQGAEHLANREGYTEARTVRVQSLLCT
jgi:hypothetical protein